MTVFDFRSANREEISQTTSQKDILLGDPRLSITAGRNNPRLLDMG